MTDTLLTASAGQSQPARPASSPAKHPWWALAVLMLPVLLVSVDNTVLAFAVPQLSSQLAPTSAQLLWIVDIYPLVLAALLVPMGVVADRWGRRRMLLIGALGFVGVSVVAAFSPNAATLVFMRATMGVFGATLMPATLALIRNIFLDGRRRRLAIAVWAATFSSGAALGPIMGGFLLEHFHWGSIFLMAVPFLLPLMIVGPVLIPESKDPMPQRVDLLSVGLVLVTMAPIVAGITAVTTGGHPVLSAGLIAVGASMGAAFIRRQLRLPNPLLNVRLFGNSVFTGSVLVNFASVIAIVGFLFFVTQDLQLIMGLSPMTAGLALLPGLAATIAAGLAVVPVVARVRPATVVAASFVLAAIGYAIVAFAGTSPGLILVAFAVLGMGIGAGETVSNDLILSHAPPEQAGAASAISETAYELGAVLGTTLIGGLLTAHFRSAITVPPTLTGEQAEAAGQTLGGAHTVAEQLTPAEGAELWANAQEAFTSGVWLTAGIGTVLMIGAAILAVTTLKSAPAT